MTVRPRERVAIGMGSNLGDRLTNLRFGFGALRRVLVQALPSSVYESDPAHLVDQPSFLNACCVGLTSLSPLQVLAELQHIERLAGRRSGGPRYGPRVLDLDLLLYGDRRMETEMLSVPHPRLPERPFVLVPLREIAGDWWVPVDAGEPVRSVADLARARGSEGVVRTDLRLEEA